MPTSSRSRPRRRSGRLPAIGLMATVLTAVSATPAAASPDHAMSQAADSPTAQQLADRLVQAGAPAAYVTVDGVDAAAGTADPGNGRPARVGDPVRVASTSKTFLAVTALRLAERHAVDLDAPLPRLAPALTTRLSPPQQVRTATLRQLLQHTAGLPDHLDDEFALRVLTDPAYGASGFDQEGLVRTALADQPLTAPGTVRYSNTGYILAGLVLEEATGTPVRRLVRDLVLRPLGLHDTGWGPHGRVVGRTARGVEVLPDGTRVDASFVNDSVAGASGDLLSTTADLQRLYDAVLEGRLLSSGSLAQLQDVLPTGDGYTSYGLGLRRFDVCGPVWGHSGHLPGYLTYAVQRDDHAVAVTITTSELSERLLGALQSVAFEPVCAP